MLYGRDGGVCLPPPLVCDGVRVGAECDAHGELAAGRGGGDEAEYARVSHMLRKCRREIEPLFCASVAVRAWRRDVSCCRC